MQESKDKYCRALDQAGELFAAMPGDQWAAPSPCEEWCGAEVAGHMIQTQWWLESLARDTTPPEASLAASAGEDPAAAWEEACAGLMASLEPAALERVVDTPFGRMPLEQLLDVITLDVLAHTWDLAQVAGSPTELDAALVHERFDAVKPLDEMLRAPGAFGPKQVAPPGASEQDQLMAFLGRRV